MAVAFRGVEEDLSMSSALVFLGFAGRNGTVPSGIDNRATKFSMFMITFHLEWQAVLDCT